MSLTSISLRMGYRKSSLVVLTGVVLLLGSPRLASAQFADNMGINLGSPRHGLTFVDVMTDTRGFATAADRTVIPTRDANGWPTEDFQITLFDLRNPFGAGSFRTEGDGDDPEEYVMDVSGTYLASFRGQADIRACCGVVVNNQNYDAASNTTTFEVVVPDDFPYMNLVLTNTRRTPETPLNSGVTNLKVIRPGYSLTTTQLFTDVWLNAIAPFSTFRYMDWSKTNNNAEFADGEARTQPVEVDWDDRNAARPDDATTTGGPFYEDTGLAWETIVEHINVTGKDAWINVPVHASDDYVRRLAQLLADNVDPSVNLYVEYSNELWNYGFTQFDWNFYKAQQEVASGSNLNYDGTTNENLLAARRTAQRTVEIAQIFQTQGVGTIGGRLRPVLAYFSSQAGNLAAGGAYETMVDVLRYVQDNYGPPSDYLHNISRTGYFGAKEIADLPEGASVDDILAAAERGIPTDYNEFSELADQYGLQFTAYEAAPGHQVGNRKNLANRIRAERSAEMGELLKRSIVDAWFGSGGNLYMFFATNKYYNRFGFWGMTDDIQKLDRNFKHQALLDVINGTDINRRPLIAVDRLTNGLQGLAYEETLDVYSGDAPLTWSLASGSLPPGLSLSNRGVIGGTPTATGVSEFTVRVTDADGDTNTRALRIQITGSIDVPQAASAPTIDGAAEDFWEEIPSYSLDNLIRGSRDGDADLSGRFKAAWDANNLYVLVDITDDVLVKDSEKALEYQDDGVELYLDINNDKLTSYGPDDYQIVFRYDDPVITVNPAGRSLSGIGRGESATTEGYRVEIALPWAALGEANPQVGTQVGFDVHAADDDDGGDRDAKIAWAAVEDRSFGDPSTFGTAILAGDSDPSSTGTAITVYAGGRTNTETMELRIDEQAVRQWENVGGSFTGDFVAYTYTATGRVSASQLQVAFVNDNGGNRDLRVDKIEVDGVVYQSEAPTTYSTGTWTRSTACNGGFKRSERLHCNGYFAYDQPDPSDGARTAEGGKEPGATRGSNSEEVLLFPNPVQEVLRLRLPAQENEVVITLTDVMGRQVLRHRQPNGREIQLPVRTLAPGLYQVRIQRGGQQTLRKVLVE